MKVTITSIVALVFGVMGCSGLSFLPNPEAFGPRAVENMKKMPFCALKCVLNPKWARTYAPELADTPLGIEYGTGLCVNSEYQVAMDDCFKDKCQGRSEARRSVIPKYKAILIAIGQGFGERHLSKLRNRFKVAALVKIASF
jgi:hypothetical protein